MAYRWAKETIKRIHKTKVNGIGPNICWNSAAQVVQSRIPSQERCTISLSSILLLGQVAFLKSSWTFRSVKRLAPSVKKEFLYSNSYLIREKSKSIYLAFKDHNKELHSEANIITGMESVPQSQENQCTQLAVGAII